MYALRTADVITYTGVITWRGQRHELALDGQRFTLSGFARPIPVVPSVGTKVEIDVKRGFVVAIRLQRPASLLERVGLPGRP